MKVADKKALCVVNTMLSFIGYLLVHATIWLSRSDINASWIFLDSGTWGLLLTLLIVVLAFWSIFWEADKYKKWYIVVAVLSIIPVIIIIISFTFPKLISAEELRRLWRYIPAIILYFAVSVLYFVMAFTKNKEAKKDDEPIPYSD